MKPSIKAVTFDVWETLLLERDGADSQRRIARCRSLSKVLEKHGVTISVDRLLSALKVLSSWLVTIWETDRDVTCLDQIQFIIKIASEGSVTVREEWTDELRSAYASALFEVPPYLNPDAQKVLQRLKDRGKVIGLICNTGMTPGFAIRRFPIEEDVAKYFDLMLFSDEAGIRKPNPRIFQRAVEQLHVGPHEAIHVGDNLKLDVWGAKNAGLRTIYLSGEIGTDKIAEADPSSLVSISRELGNLKETSPIPDNIIASLSMIAEVIENLENS